jgi:hypothetical protein
MAIAQTSVNSLCRQGISIFSNSDLDLNPSDPIDYQKKDLNTGYLHTKFDVGSFNYSQVIVQIRSG